MKDLDRLKEVFLTADDLDEETRADNLERITEWEKSLRENRVFAQWQNLDISKSIADQARAVYKDCSMQLALRRDLNDAQRYSLWAKQDASAWLLSLIAKDAPGTIAQIEHEIKTALTAT